MVFNGQVDAHLYLVKSEKARSLLKDGAAYAFAASGRGIKGLNDESTRGQVIEVYVKALRMVWLVMMALALVGLISVPLEKHIEMRKEHATEFGLEEKMEKLEDIEEGKRSVAGMDKDRQKD